MPRFRLAGENIQSILIMHFVCFQFAFFLFSIFFLSCIYDTFNQFIFIFICFCSVIVASVLYCSVSTTHSVCNCYIQFVRNTSLKAYNQQYFISQNAFVRCFMCFIYYLLKFHRVFFLTRPFFSLSELHCCFFGAYSCFFLLLNSSFCLLLV